MATAAAVAPDHPLWISTSLWWTWGGRVFIYLGVISKQQSKAVIVGTIVVTFECASPESQNLAQPSAREVSFYFKWRHQRGIWIEEAERDDMRRWWFASVVDLRTLFVFFRLFSYYPGRAHHLLICINRRWMTAVVVVGGWQIAQVSWRGGWWCPQTNHQSIYSNQMTRWFMGTKRTVAEEVKRQVLSRLVVLIPSWIKFTNNIEMRS